MSDKRRRRPAGPRVPFVVVDGRPHLVVNFDLEPRGDLPPLSVLLEGLLKHGREEDILLLRPLAPAEARLLRQSIESAEVESWAQIAVTLEDRWRPRPRQRRRR